MELVAADAAAVTEALTRWLSLVVCRSWQSQHLKQKRADTDSSASKRKVMEAGGRVNKNVGVVGVRIELQQKMKLALDWQRGRSRKLTVNIK